MRINGIEITGEEVRIIIEFPDGKKYVDEIVNHNGDYGLVVQREKIGTWVYFGHNDIWYIENDDIERR
jgi:hypothetical protein